MKILIVSNRLPISVIRREGTLRLQPSVGGLATGLSSFHKECATLWIGWSGLTVEKIGAEKEEVTKKLMEQNLYPIFLQQTDVENHYHGFCNKTLWPLFHYFPLHTVYNKNFWESYRRVNALFCEKVLENAEEQDLIWVHDYHLMLLPAMLRERLSRARIGFFLHIPFPSFEVFRLLPWRRELVKGVLGADLVGFHTYDYVRYFTDSVRSLLGYEHTLGQINVGNRIVRVDTFPMGIDYSKFSEAIRQPEVRREVKRILKKVGERKVILSIDRLDYTKGIPERLEAFDMFLEKYPEYKEKVTLILVAVPSRTSVEHYILLKKQVDELVGRINGRHGTIGWMPVWYLYRFLHFPTLVSLYHIADVVLLTPLRDGMNLIAKEFVATKVEGKGVLILSEMAGAAKELGEALIVNPNNKEEVVKALKEALSMKEEEQRERNILMQKRLQRYNVRRWAHDFVDRLCHVKKMQEVMETKRFTEYARDELLSDYRKSRTRLLFLDYDGTLVPFAERPQKAEPQDLLELLEKVARPSKNEVVIISGRDKETLQQWFGFLPLSLVAEHGVWIKEKGKDWEMAEHLSNEWKQEIRPLLEVYVDRTPGSFIEEKEFSLVWHYRKADPELASLRARELKNALLHLCANLNLGVLEGAKVVEIKSANVNKGRAALRWLAKREWEFIMAAGDDWTDEDIFNVLPQRAYSLKVGFAPSKAKFNLENVEEIKSLLQLLSTIS